MLRDKRSMLEAVNAILGLSRGRLYDCRADRMRPSGRWRRSGIG